MPVFEYIAEDTQGRRTTGVYEEVAGLSQLQEELSKLGYTLLTARKSYCHSKGAGIKGRIKPGEIVSFAYEFSGMYSAGLSVTRCLETMELQSSNMKMKSILSAVRQKVETGGSLSDGFEPFRSVFGNFFMGMLEAGQTGGKLAESLKRAAEYLEKQQEIRSKVRGAFAYPIIVAVMCILIVTAIMIFVIPVFQKLYQQLHVPLPWPTQLLIVVSHVIRKYCWLFPIVIGGGYWGWGKLKRNRSFKKRIDLLLLRIPLFGPLHKLVLVSRYIRTFSMMASAGVGFVEALEQARQVCSHTEMDIIGRKLEQKVMTGSSFSQPLGRFPLFPPLILQLAAAGEEAGVLPEMLNKGADYLDADIERRIRSLIVKIEPLLSIFMGLIVGLVLLGVYLPMFDYMGHVK